MTYPAFVCSFFLVVMGVATFWIIPQFRQIYSSYGATLPLLTEIVFKANQFILNYFPVMIVAGIAAVVALVFWARRPRGRAVMDHIFLKVPIFGSLIHLAGLARLCRSMATLLEGGIPINRALEMARDTTGNTVLSKAVEHCRQEVLKVGKIAASFKQRKVFPPMMVRMIAAGEETGSLNNLLLAVADFYESRVDTALSAINSLIEPIMIVIIGCFVLVFVLSMYLPIFNLSSAIR